MRSIAKHDVSQGKIHGTLDSIRTRRRNRNRVVRSRTHTDSHTCRKIHGDSPATSEPSISTSVPKVGVHLDSSKNLTETYHTLSRRTILEDEVDLRRSHRILGKLQRLEVVVQENNLHGTNVVRNLALSGTRQRRLIRLNATNRCLERNLEENVSTTTAGKSLRSRQTGSDIHILRRKEIDRSISLLKLNLGQRKRIHKIRKATLAGHVARQNLTRRSHIGRNLDSIGSRNGAIVDLESLLRTQARRT